MHTLSRVFSACTYVKSANSMPTISEKYMSTEKDEACLVICHHLLLYPYILHKKATAVQEQILTVKRIDIELFTVKISAFHLNCKVVFHF